MKLKFYSLLTFIIFSIPAFGQITLNKADLIPNIGDTVRMHSADYMQPGAGGANVTWDFSTLNSTGSSILKYETNTIWNDSFNSAPTFIANQESLYFEFYGADDDSLYVKGAVIDYDTDTVVQVYDDPILQMVFPCTYNTAFTDDYYVEYNFLGTDVITTGTVTGTVDGYGTLKLPWGDVENVIRIKFFDDRVDSFDMGFGQEAQHIITTRYTWYAEGVAGPVLNLVSTSSTQATQQSAAYIDGNSVKVSINTITAEEINLSIYPNPISNTEVLTIDFDNGKNVDFEEVIITDITGKVVQQKEIDDNSFTSVKLDIYSLKKGLYFVTLKSGNVSVTKKLTVY